MPTCAVENDVWRRRDPRGRTPDSASSSSLRAYRPRTNDPTQMAAITSPPIRVIREPRLHRHGAGYVMP
jgi:hypothetical protein